MVAKIIKRDGRIAPFKPQKIEQAIFKAASAVGRPDHALAQELAKQVVAKVERHYPAKQIPAVEEVQNFVEQVLIENRQANIAKAYILYRQKRTQERMAKMLLGVSDDLKLPLNAIRVLERRYLLKDEKGTVIESPKQLLSRVARAVAAAETKYGQDAKQAEADFFTIMSERKFMPNSPTLMNAGTDIGQLSACFVLPVADSIEGIFDTLKHMAIIHKTGGGTGFSFSKLRPKGDLVRTTTGVASGPVSFMRIYDTATDVIKQGGRRRGANMGILHFDHPDIEEFVVAKEREETLANFNISVAVTDEFMEAVQNDKPFNLINPRNGRITKQLRAKNLFDLIVAMAWRTGDPGLIFLDEINRANPTPALGYIESTNPCGEQPLLPYESCNLGSINLAETVKNGQIDWDELRKVVRIAVHFLDNVIDVNKYPLQQIQDLTLGNRKIGLGVMGFAEMLIKLGIPYQSPEALETAEKVMKFISEEAQRRSVELAQVRGSFPNFKQSVWPQRGVKAIRNATLTTVAPTGTISIIASTSSGIEPLFAISYMREVLEGTQLLEVNPLFKQAAQERGFYSERLMQQIAKLPSIQTLTSIPQDVRRLFLTTFDVSGEWHVRVQAAFQKYVDNAVSKTVNLPADASIEDVRRIYLLAYQLKCKGITIYRYGSKKRQVLYLAEQAKSPKETQYVRAKAEYGGECLAGECVF
jgi:ribonucleoside-diphosphate reductase alpha chain